MYSAIDLHRLPGRACSAPPEPKRYIQPRSIEYLTGSAFSRCWRVIVEQQGLAASDLGPVREVELHRVVGVDPPEVPRPEQRTMFLGGLIQEIVLADYRTGKLGERIEGPHILDHVVPDLAADLVEFVFGRDRLEILVVPVVQLDYVGRRLDAGAAPGLVPGIERLATFEARQAEHVDAVGHRHVVRAVMRIHVVVVAGDERPADRPVHHLEGDVEPDRLPVVGDDLHHRELRSLVVADQYLERQCAAVGSVAPAVAVLVGDVESVEQLAGAVRIELRVTNLEFVIVERVARRRRHSVLLGEAEHHLVVDAAAVDRDLQRHAEVLLQEQLGDVGVLVIEVVPHDDRVEGAVPHLGGVVAALLVLAVERERLGLEVESGPVRFSGDHLAVEDLAVVDLLEHDPVDVGELVAGRIDGPVVRITLVNDQVFLAIDQYIRSERGRI